MNVSQSQREAKATFWKRAAGNPLLVPDKIKDADIRRLTPGGEELPLSSKPFREWFLNKEQFEILLDSSREAALGLLIRKVTMTDEEAKKAKLTHAVQISAAKILLDKAGVGQDRIVVSDSTINDMSEDELEAFIEAKKPKAVKLKAVDVKED